jgi:hypothetical protein
MAYAGIAASVILLVLVISGNVSKSRLRLEADGLKERIADLESAAGKARAEISELGSARADLNGRVRMLQDQVAIRDMRIKELLAAQAPPPPPAAPPTTTAAASPKPGEKGSPGTPTDGTAAPGPGQTAPKPVRIYINANATLYHKAPCKYITKTAKVVTLEEAKRRKLAPCKNCQPPL